MPMHKGHSVSELYSSAVQGHSNHIMTVFSS